MAVIDIDGWISLHVEGFQADGEKFQMGWNFKNSTNITDPAVLNSLCDVFWTAVSGTFLGSLPTASAVTRVWARTHYSPPYIEGQATGTFPQSGTASGDPLPNNTAEVISWKTSYIGRRYRGRSFYPATVETSTTADRYLSAFINQLAIMAVRYIAGFSASGITFLPAVPSRKGVFLNIIKGYYIDFFIEALRDRLPRHHRHKRHTTPT
jgi:hypothetical protein